MVKRAKVAIPELDDFFEPLPITSQTAQPIPEPAKPATDSASCTATCATNEVGPQAAMPSSPARVEAQSRDALKQIDAASGGASEPIAVDPIPDDVMNPFTGEMTRLDDIDGLIGLYEGLDKVNKQAYAVMVRVREVLAAKAEGDSKTRRVCGERRKAKLEFPSESFTQRDLRTIWEDFPDLRDQVLKIDEIGVSLREYRKLINTSGPERFMEFRDKLTRACKGCVGLPTLKVEE